MSRARFGDEERGYMREAIELARGGLEGVSPNPLVGAVLVRDRRVVARGFHRVWGGDHAEVDLLRRTREARGGHLYVTLEPCGHRGKTPPCSDACLAAGVARVVYAVSDPNPETRGRGPRALRHAGVVVESGLLRREAQALNAPYFHWRRTGRPWVILKWAMSLDGKTATVGGESRWITGPAARARGHAIRRRVDAILAGTRTVLADDPRLTPRPARGRRPWRIVLDRRGALPLDRKLLAPSSRPIEEEKRACIVGPRAPARRRRELERRGVQVLEAREASGVLTPDSILDAIASLGVSQLLVEGGGELAGSFVHAGLVDEVAAFIAPRIVGGRSAAGGVGGAGIARLGDALRIEWGVPETLGDDWMLAGRVRR